MSTRTYDDRRSGWIEFSAIVMFAVGFFRIISAISYYRHSDKLTDLSAGLFSSHDWAWGTWDVVIAAVAILAGLSLLGGGGFGRVIGYIWAVLVIVQGFAVIGLAPWYGAIAITLGVLVIYGLASSARQPS